VCDIQLYAALCLKTVVEKVTSAHEDDDDNPKSKNTKAKGKPKSVPFTEDVRANLYTLDENHEHLLSGSFDVSLNESGAFLPSSSQFDGVFGFGLDDNLFCASDGLDIGEGIGDELARELGEGWGGSSSGRSRKE
jgi:hypothetical protein